MSITKNIVFIDLKNPYSWQKQMIIREKSKGPWGRLADAKKGSRQKVSMLLLRSKRELKKKSAKNEYQYCNKTNQIPYLFLLGD